MQIKDPQSVLCKYKEHVPKEDKLESYSGNTTIKDKARSLPECIHDNYLADRRYHETSLISQTTSKSKNIYTFSEA